MLFSHGPNNTFLIPDSCGSTDDTIKNDYKDACFNYFQTIWLVIMEFFIERLTFLSVSKARANKLYIFRQCTNIVYLI